ncbi:MAG: DNA helicase UvrD [SAR202 cluster bacterium]|nr:DNA helicase UvrD [SAR202 cluster bacterium]
MTYVADLHMHSPFARECSKLLTFENLAATARKKGIHLLASGDFTHPKQLEATKRMLREAGGGLFEYGDVKFILGTEVNSIAEEGGRRRRVHLLLFAPTIHAVERVNRELAKAGNLLEDGRPTVRVSPREIVTLLKEVDERCFLIPAHLWTPWYGIYGSRSGFDSLEECFGDSMRHIHGIEIGLSSDPAMNWRTPSLDNVSILSFSDAHSLPNMGREVTVFNGKPSYDGLVKALRQQDIAYTVEFFPEEGKYHYSGHRQCGVSLAPEQVREQGVRCPVCKRKMTIGVMQRVEDLAGRGAALTREPDGTLRGPTNRPPFRHMVSLRQIVGESLGTGPTGKRATALHERILGELGPEIQLLTETDPKDLGPVAGERVTEGIMRVRRGEVSIMPGFDGEYGKVSVWPAAEPAMRPR